MGKFTVDKALKRMVAFFVLGIVICGALRVEAEAQTFRDELPFKRIDFVVQDLKSGECLSIGDESIDYEESKITKVTNYYRCDAKTKAKASQDVIQKESSTVDLATLKVFSYEMRNFVTGEAVKLSPKDEAKVETEYVASKAAPAPVRSELLWDSQTIIGKTLHHFMVRQAEKLRALKNIEFKLLVPMKRDIFGFRLRPKKASDETLVVSLEPSNWAIRSFVPQMDFHYKSLNGVFSLVRYEGATTVAIDGDDSRLVAIDFAYVK